jgi:hypothetical protein
MTRFKIGDRVKYIGTLFSFTGCCGTIVSIRTFDYYGVELDNGLKSLGGDGSWGITSSGMILVYDDYTVDL